MNDSVLWISLTMFSVIFVGGYFVLRARDQLTNRRIVALFLLGAVFLVVPAFVWAGDNPWFIAGAAIVTAWIAGIAIFLGRFGGEHE